MGGVAAYLKRVSASAGALVSVAAVTVLALLLFDALAAVGQGSNSAEPRRGSPSKGRDTAPPSRLRGLAVSRITQTGLTLRWNASRDNVGVTGYDLYRDRTKVATVTRTFTSRTGRLTCGSSYTFGVVARDAAGNASKKGQLRVSMPACVPIAPPYFVADYANGAFAAPWTILFSHAPPGFTDLTKSGARPGTGDGRVSVAVPRGSSQAAARFELRNTDPAWPIDSRLDKSEVRAGTQETFGESAVTVGDVRWFSTRIYLPYTSTEKFEWAHGGSNPFTALLGLHPGADHWGALGLRWNSPKPRNQWATLLVYGGDFPTTKYAETIKLWQLTDGSGKRVMWNHNRWINLVWGMRFAPDSTGWLEVWVDGVNVYPRKSRPTMWTGDTGQYLKIGLYKQRDAIFPETGRSIVYFGRTTIGLTKP